MVGFIHKIETGGTQEKFSLPCPTPSILYSPPPAAKQLRRTIFTFTIYLVTCGRANCKIVPQFLSISEVAYSSDYDFRTRFHSFTIIRAGQMAEKGIQFPRDAE